MKWETSDILALTLLGIVIIFLFLIFYAPRGIISNQDAKEIIIFIIGAVTGRMGQIMQKDK